MKEQDIDDKIYMEAVQSHERMKQCISKINSQEKRFLENVNKMPELSEKILGLPAMQYRDGEYMRHGNELYGNIVDGFDPGLRDSAKYHYDKKRKQCR